MSRGKLFVVSGPSGVGKGTVCQALLENRDDLFLSVSATTRAPRPGEENGVHYWFLSKEEFQDRVEHDQFLEWATFCENCYGTPRSKVEEKLDAGQNVLLEIEPQGALQVKERLPESVLLFVLPPSLQELRQRLIGRGTEDASVVEQRLCRAREEFQFIPKYDYVLINDEIPKAVERFAHILEVENYRTKNSQEIIDEVLKL